MKLQRLFYFLLALPLVFAACDTTQDADNAKAPVLTLTSADTLEFGDEGGEGAISYTLENAVNGVDVTAECDDDWVIIFSTTNEVTFEVHANDGYTARETKIVVAYGELSFEVTIKQATNCTVWESRGYLGSCNGTNYSDNYNYSVSLKDIYDGDTKLPITLFVLDLYSIEGEKDEDGKVCVAPGTYRLDTTDSKDKWTIYSKSSAFKSADPDTYETTIIKFSDATFVVTETDATLTATAGGTKYIVTFEGKIKYDAPKPLGSNLVNDINCNLSDHTISVKNYGDTYNVGYQNWVFTISPTTGSGEGVIFELIAGTSTTDFYGEYTISNSHETFTACPGTYPDFNGSMYYFTLNGENMSNYGIFVDGWVKVIDNSDGTATVTFDVHDIAGYNITGTWTGVMTEPEHK